MESCITLVTTDSHLSAADPKALVAVTSVDTIIGTTSGTGATSTWVRRLCDIKEKKNNSCDYGKYKISGMRKLIQSCAALTYEVWEQNKVNIKYKTYKRYKNVDG